MCLCINIIIWKTTPTNISDEVSESPLNLCIKKRSHEIWSPGSLCEKEKSPEIVVPKTFTDNVLGVERSFQVPINNRRILTHALLCICSTKWKTHLRFCKFVFVCYVYIIHTYYCVFVLYFTHIPIASTQSHLNMFHRYNQRALSWWIILMRTWTMYLFNFSTT